MLFIEDAHHCIASWNDNSGWPYEKCASYVRYQRHMIEFAGGGKPVLEIYLQ